MQLPLPNSTTNDLLPRVDFDLTRWKQLLDQKGIDVLIEKSFHCPCKTIEMNALSNCKSCGGTGWVFVNARNSRIVLQGMSVSKDYEPWSEANKGTINFSCFPNENLTYMDRITRLNAISIFNEVLSFKVSESGEVFCYATYKIKDIDALLIYNNPGAKLTVLNKNQDFTFVDNIVYLKPNVTVPVTELTGSIRYFHNPTFHVLEITREAVDNFVLTNNQEKIQQLPVRGVARRAHFIADMENLAGDRLLNNDFSEIDCPEIDRIFTNQFQNQFT